ncbi:GNAT family N-acetyltransferase [Pelagibacterium sp. 26DY04]|uniref:GNAT family N-acetyltransferase n=1 Tax=Pelagibacterium sp. 26DY04 TaxID=2967130 RepID=UPI0028163865|nr:GNAT family N-acetyltransferase [Pelagibacterium sp. 26DY04]WMT87819.1 GNAT family N-acetyltransferase [Pelagibacterium sp. 26DY04]
MSRLAVKPVTRASWSDFEALFESKGAPSYCWCMAWRPIEDRTEATNADRKRTLKSFVDRRLPIGIVGYLEKEPVAWCSVAPRSTHVSLSKQQNDGEEGVWSVTCFFVRRAHRGTGLSGQMLDAAIAYAKKKGARIIESYPVDPESPSYRFMGFVELFEKRGFAEIGRAGTRRHIMRLTL